MTIYHGYTEPPELTHARWLDRCAAADEKIAKLEIAKAIEEERKRQPARNAQAALHLLDAPVALDIVAMRARTFYRRLWRTEIVNLHRIPWTNKTRPCSDPNCEFCKVQSW